MVSPWRVERRDDVASCRVFEVRRLASEQESTGRRADFFVLDAADWINVMAVTEDGRMVLVRQYRHGTGDFTLEVPGGMVDPGETPLEAARRELLEESGYASDDWTEIGAVEPNPAIQGNVCHTFLAAKARRVAEPTPSEHEELDVELRPVTDRHDLVRDGTIRHALVICAFHAYDLQVEKKTS
jgi:ADP-ribose pyrophosphatase